MFFRKRTSVSLIFILYPNLVKFFAILIICNFGYMCLSSSSSFSYSSIKAGRTFFRVCKRFWFRSNSTFFFSILASKLASFEATFSMLYVTFYKGSLKLVTLRARYKMECSTSIHEMHCQWRWKLLKTGRAKLALRFCSTENGVGISV